MTRNPYNLVSPCHTHVGSWSRDAARGRFSVQETLVEGEPLTHPNPSPHSRLTPQPPHLNPTRLSHPTVPTPYIAPHHMHSSSSTSSSSSHVTSPSSSSSSYRGSGLYSPSSSALDSARYNSPRGRKTTYRY
ncbi:hypothetical protein GWK47_022316 [Chionoecetes opilio]|uniref:Uncharacterized protein n=1 Tax=Chionoecetes opilio TaxID=41210 RepID=A0A8J4XSC4_CHIOP|nr:hypothetical protein GWK47_022316 [Chionoecetes opilio]